MFTFCLLQNATNKIYRLYWIRYSWSIICIISKQAANINKIIFTLKMFLKCRKNHTLSLLPGNCSELKITVTV